ncbi:SDR family oxidoreductase [bacterium]|nr:MAG: SDR family oxidoreductase [bacterium]
MIDDLRGKTALVTGSSQGIGKAIALALAAQGVSLGLCARGKENLESAAADAKKAGSPKVVVAAADCTDPGDVKGMVSTISSGLGHIDILVNCVGRAKAGPFLQLTDQDWLETINLKLMAAVRVTREVLPHMIEAKAGRIINIGGVFGTKPSPFSLPMGVVNAGLFNFTKGLAQDAVRHGVLVNAISPGRVDTPLFEKLVERQAQQTGVSRERALETILSDVPIGRAGTAAEIANAVLYLASDLSSYVVGEILTVDGGWVKCL